MDECNANQSGLKPSRFAPNSNPRGIHGLLMTPTNASDVTRTTLAVLFIGILIAASFWVMRPSLTSLLWASMIVIATWPTFLKLQTRLCGQRWLVVLLMTVLLLLFFLV